MNEEHEMTVPVEEIPRECPDCDNTEFGVTDIYNSLGDQRTHVAVVVYCTVCYTTILNKDVDSAENPIND